MLDRLERIGLVERMSEKRFLHRITTRWFDTVTLAKAERKGEQSSPIKENKVSPKGEQSSPEKENKVPPHKDIYKESKDFNKEAKNAENPLSPPYKKVADIYPETLEADEQAKPTSPGGGAIRVSITGPEHPDIAVQDVIEPKTEPPKNSRGKAKNPRTGTQEEIELAERVIQHLNQTAGRSFRVNTGDNAKGIIARYREGFTEAELLQVVEFKAGKWKSDPEMYEYLNPVTLFRPANFERYLQAARAIAPKPQQQPTRSTIQTFRGADYGNEKQAF